MLLACAAIVLGCLLPAGATAAGIPAVSTTSANPPAFVPNWDGHTDATIIHYVIVEESSVVVRIVDARGRTVTTIDSGRRAPGTYLVAWDGRDRHGVVQPAGRYRVRVDATPVARPESADAPGSANSGGTVTAASLASAITLQEPAVAIRGIELSRADLGRSRAHGTTTARFDLSAAASVSAAIVDRSGRPVRTLATGRMGAGRNALSWNGRTTAGRPVPNGDYELIVSASGAGRPTATNRLPLSVDRAAPKVSAPRRVRATVSSRGVAAALRLTIDEPTTALVSRGRRSAKFTLAAGTRSLRLATSMLGSAGRTRSRTVRLRLRVYDAAGNAVVRSVTVVVPKRGSTTPKPPTTSIPPSNPDPDPVKPIAGGKLPWPVDGIVTSPFGMRSGRMHTGIDIAVPTGTPIHPVGAGRVSYVGVLGGYGNLVMVDHSNGLRTYYAHMSRFGSFGVGEAVGHADVIGYVGCTGTCTGPHVHFETRNADIPGDPMAYLAAS